MREQIAAREQASALTGKHCMPSLSLASYTGQKLCRTNNFKAQPLALFLRQIQQVATARYQEGGPPGVGRGKHEIVIRVATQHHSGPQIDVGNGITSSQRLDKTRDERVVESQSFQDPHIFGDYSLADDQLKPAQVPPQMDQLADR